MPGLSVLLFSGRSSQAQAHILASFGILQRSKPFLSAITNRNKVKFHHDHRCLSSRCTLHSGKWFSFGYEHMNSGYKPMKSLLTPSLAGFCHSLDDCHSNAKEHQFDIRDSVESANLIKYEPSKELYGNFLGGRGGKGGGGLNSN